MLKYSQIPGVFKLEGNRLGRPYHRLPNMFSSKFDIIDSRLGNYFLKKHRTNISLKKINCEMDISNKNAVLMISPVGHVAFDIDRTLLLTLLGNFYGLEGQAEENTQTDVLPTKTEIRLKNRLALDICSIVFNKDTLGLPLNIKLDNSTIISQWAYQINFSLGDNENSHFSILLDDAHTDYILNFLRQKEHNRPDEPVSSRKEEQQILVKQIINTLPLQLNVKVAELPLSVADLTTIKPGDILPLTMPDKFPVYIGKSELFHALIVEDQEKLYLSEITENTSEKSYE